MSKKRVADTDLNHDNWNDEEEPDEIGVFARASSKQMSDRKVIRAKRRGNNTTSDNIFSTFKGFSNTPTVQPGTPGTFDFIKTLSVPQLGNNKNSITSTADKPGRSLFSQSPSINSNPLLTKQPPSVSPSSTISANTSSSPILSIPSSSSLSKKSNAAANDDENDFPNAQKTKRIKCDEADNKSKENPEAEKKFQCKIEALNIRFVKFIEDKIKSNPYVLLLPPFQDYRTYVEKFIKEKLEDENKMKLEKEEGYNFQNIPSRGSSGKVTFQNKNSNEIKTFTIGNESERNSESGQNNQQISNTANVSSTLLSTTLSSSNSTTNNPSLIKSNNFAFEKNSNVINTNNSFGSNLNSNLSKFTSSTETTLKSSPLFSSKTNNNDNSDKDNKNNILNNTNITSKNTYQKPNFNFGSTTNTNTNDVKLTSSTSNFTFSKSLNTSSLLSNEVTSNLTKNNMVTTNNLNKNNDNINKSGNFGESFFSNSTLTTGTTSLGGKGATSDSKFMFGMANKNENESKNKINNDEKNDKPSFSFGSTKIGGFGVGATTTTSTGNLNSTPSLFSSNFNSGSSTSLFSFKPSNVSSGGTSESNGTGSSTSLFSFKPSNVSSSGGTSESNGTGTKAGGEDDDDVLPKEEVKEIIEEDSIFTIKCKIYVKKSDNSYGERGIGNLFIKCIEKNIKGQIIVRTSTDSGKIILNILITKQIPCTLEKNNIILVTIPHPTVEKNPEPKTCIIKVKTKEDATKLKEVIDTFRQ